MNTLSEISINYKPNIKLSELPKVITSRDAENQFRALWSDKMQHVEEMYMMVLNRANRVLGYSLISKGGISGTVVDLKIIFQTALKSNASSIILAHNHPSANLKPSEADIRITRNVREAGKILEIPLLDHLIITSEGFYSFADEGAL